jgi:hypothetical protein
MGRRLGEGKAEAGGQCSAVQYGIVQQYQEDIDGMCRMEGVNRKDGWIEELKGWEGWMDWSMKGWMEGMEGWDE